ncbi:hypothetical protein TNCV_1425461 [Trichonephila clavipes]|nr:hypothetical protein TNCV_1425461 [Trichonephila clavipes]
MERVFDWRKIILSIDMLSEETEAFVLSLFLFDDNYIGIFPMKRAKKSANHLLVNVGSRGSFVKVPYRFVTALVVKVKNSLPACHEFEPSAADDPLCRWSQFTFQSRLKCPPIGVVWKFGEGLQLECHPRHLTGVQNYEVRRHKPSSS